MPSAGWRSHGLRSPHGGGSSARLGFSGIRSYSSVCRCHQSETDVCLGSQSGPRCGAFRSQLMTQSGRALEKSSARKNRALF